MIEVRTGAGHPRVAEAVLFPFDDQGIPFSAGLRLHLVSGKSPGTQSPIVLAPGAAGAPDDARDALLRHGHPGGGRAPDVVPGLQPRRARRAYRACYAVSRDGLHWERPRLGLVEHGGNRANNLLDFPDGRGGTLPIAALPVLHDPDDPDPARRFKCAFESRPVRQLPGRGLQRTGCAGRCPTGTPSARCWSRPA